MTQKQPNLEAIRLVTDGSCRSKPESSAPLALCAFPRLKRFCWSGVRSEVDLETLTDLVQQRSDQLEELEIDLTYHRSLLLYFDVDGEGDEEEEDDEDAEARTVNRFMRLGSARFPVLRRLALSSFSLAPWGSLAGSDHVLGRMRPVLDFGLLRSLRIRYCEGWEEFLLVLSRRARPPRLRSLEITWWLNEDDPSMPHEAIQTFLRAFKGLEELFLNADSGADPLDVWTAALHHRASLRRFVHHQRGHLGTGNGGIGRPRDIPGLFFFDPDPSLDPEDAPSRLEAPPLGELDLTTIGLSCAPHFMVR